jgi:hypothetical protein
MNRAGDKIGDSSKVRRDPKDLALDFDVPGSYKIGDGCIECPQAKPICVYPAPQVALVKRSNSAEDTPSAFFKPSNLVVSVDRVSKATDIKFVIENRRHGPHSFEINGILIGRKRD